MTRITFDWLMFFVVGGGILLLASGESTVSAIAEQTTNNKESSLLSVAVTSSSSVDASSTSEHLKNDSGLAPPADNEMKSNISIENDDSSKHSSTSVSKDKASTQQTSSSNETTMEDNVDKAELQKSEAKTELKAIDDTHSSNEVTDAIQNDNNLNSDTYLSTSEANTAPVVSGDKNEETDQNTTNTEMSVERSTEKLTSDSESNGTGKSDVGLSSTLTGSSTKKYPESEPNEFSSQMDHTTTGISEFDATENSNLVETSGNPVTIETKSSLSSKSATKKRSINSTITSTLSDESLPTSIIFSSPFPQRGTDGSEMSSFVVDIALENGFTSTKSPRESVSLGEMQTTELNPVTNGMTLPHVAELYTEDGEGIERKTENSLEVLHSEQLRPEDMVGEIVLYNTSEGVMSSTKNVTSEFAGKVNEAYSMVSGSTLNPSNDVSHGIENEDGTAFGVTFDPDGMKNDGPQDPDSVVFSTPYKKVGTSQTMEYSTYKMSEGSGHSTASEFTTEVEKEFNPNEAFVNRTQEFEALENPNVEKQNKPVPFYIRVASHNIYTTLNPISVSTISPDDSESQTAGASSSPKEHAETNYSDFEMLQDAPHVFSSDHNQSKSDDIKVIEIDAKPMSPESSSGLPVSSSHLVPVDTEAPMVETSSSFIVHQTEQSVIRPVKVKISASPSDSSASTSIQPASAYSAVSSPSPSVPTSGSSDTTARVETNPTGMSSPIILPNPAPSTTEIGDRVSELSTLLPELSSASRDEAGNTIATETASFNNAGANSTIAGVAVKTSVSVSLPLSNTRNDSGTTFPSAFDELLKNSSIVILPGNPPTIIVRENNDSSSLTTGKSSSDGLTLTTESTTETTTAAGVKILKPKIKVPGGSDTRTRRPYVPSQKRPTTTAGPPVSIFKKSRTRGASITSSTTAKPFRPFSTIRVHYASDIPGMVPGGELLISTEPVTEPPTTTEEPFSEEPFTDQTYTPSVSTDDDVTLVKVAGYIMLERGIRWKDQLSNRHSLEYKEEAKLMHLHLERLFRSSSIAHRLWKIEIDGFSGNKKSRSVAVDFFLYLIKSHEDVSPDHLVSVLQEKLSANNTFARFRVDPSRTAFERLAEERMIKTTPLPDQETVEPPIPQWAIAVIVIGAASLIFIVLFAAVTMYGRHHMRRRYSSKLNEEDMERSSGEWESKMAAAYENMAADTIYDAEDLHSDTYKKSRIATFHGIPSTLKRCDSWSSNGWTTPPKRKRPHVH